MTSWGGIVACSPSLPHMRDCPHGDLSYDVLLQSWCKVTVGSGIQQQLSGLLHLSCFVLCARPWKLGICRYVKKNKVVLIFLAEKFSRGLIGSIVLFQLQVCQGTWRGEDHLWGFTHRKAPESIYPKQHEGKIAPQMGTVSQAPARLPDCLYMRDCTVVTDSRMMLVSPPFQVYLFIFFIYQFCQINQHAQLGR